MKITQHRKQFSAFSPTHFRTKDFLCLGTKSESESFTGKTCLRPAKKKSMPVFWTRDAEDFNNSHVGVSENLSPAPICSCLKPKHPPIFFISFLLPFFLVCVCVLVCVCAGRSTKVQAE